MTPFTPERAAAGARWLAVGRAVLGISAMVAPELVGRSWIGAEADRTGSKVLARALGGRDVVIGLGTLTAMGEQENDDTLVSASRWIAFGGLADLSDFAATVLSWRKLPKANRWLVAGLSGTSAVVSLIMAAKLVEPEKDMDGFANVTFDEESVSY